MSETKHGKAMYILFPTRAIRYDHDGHCSGAENEGVEEEPPLKKQCGVLVEKKTRRHLQTFERQCVQENSSQPLDSFLSLFRPHTAEEYGYSIDYSGSGFCEPAAPIHFPHAQETYHHEMVYMLADHGKRTVARAVDMPPRHVLRVYGDMGPFYELRPGTNVIAICRAFMPHVLALLAGLKASGVVKPLRQLAVLRFIKGL